MKLNNTQRMRQGDSLCARVSRLFPGDHCYIFAVLIRADDIIPIDIKISWSSAAAWNVCRFEKIFILSMETGYMVESPMRNKYVLTRASDRRRFC